MVVSCIMVAAVIVSMDRGVLSSFLTGTFFKKISVYDSMNIPLVCNDLSEEGALVAAFGTGSSHPLASKLRISCSLWYKQQPSL